MQTFRDRTAVITGAASGIGLELARRAAAEGMNLFLADIEGDKLAETAAGLGVPDGYPLVGGRRFSSLANPFAPLLGVFNTGFLPGFVDTTAGLVAPAWRVFLR